MLEKLKKRWGISSAWQVVLILIVFAATGFSTLYTHRFINLKLGVTDDTEFWKEVIIFVVLILPIYTVLLYLWGVILGQKKFFSKFIKMKINILSKWIKTIRCC